jgi:hypothetical protein
MSVLNTIDDTCRAINSNIRFLARVFHNKTNSDESYRVQKTLNTAINTDPTIVMKRVGPYLLKYADPISKHDEQFFLNKEWCEDTAGEDDPDQAMDAIVAIKKIYQQCNTVEREKIMNTVSDMLSHYCEYTLVASKIE